MMNIVDVFDVVDSSINWVATFYAFCIIGVVLMAFHMQLSENYERSLGRDNKHGPWGLLRRVSMTLQMLTMLWCASYGYEAGWRPWPPFVCFIAAVDLHILVRIIMLRTDTSDYRKGLFRVFHCGFDRNRNAR